MRGEKKKKKQNSTTKTQGPKGKYWGEKEERYDY